MNKRIKKMALLLPLIFVMTVLATVSFAEERPITAPKGWVYYGGDEFNDNSVDESKWNIFDDDNNFAYLDGLISLYNREQVIEKDGFLTVRSERYPNRMVVTPDGQERQPWNSGAINSSGVGVYYPLYSKIEIRLKSTNVQGIWHAFWLGHYKGIWVTELDVFETLLKANGPGIVSQSFHSQSTTTGELGINLSNHNPRETYVPDVADKFHTYAVSIEKIPDAPDEANITFYVDDKVSYSVRSDSVQPKLFNKFVTETRAENREDSAWNLIFTGQVGSSSPDIGYPEEHITKGETVIDYIRVYVPEEKEDTPTPPVVTTTVAPATTSSTISFTTKATTSNPTTTTKSTTKSTTKPTTTTKSTTKSTTKPTTTTKSTTKSTTKPTTTTKSTSKPITKPTTTTKSTTKSTTKPTTTTKSTTKSTTKPITTTKSTSKPTTKLTTKPSVPKQKDTVKPVYRLYHEGLKVHLYTTDTNERDTLKKRGWRYEGEAWKTSTKAGEPVYRLYHSGLRVHLYTKDANEYKVLGTRGWKQEGIAYRSHGDVKVYRLYHGGIKKHHYTKDVNEYNTLGKRGWKQEDIAWYSEK